LGKYNNSNLFGKIQQFQLVWENTTIPTCLGKYNNSNLFGENTIISTCLGKHNNFNLLGENTTIPFCLFYYLLLMDSRKLTAAPRFVL
jgi:hypothetical protein